MIISEEKALEMVRNKEVDRVKDFYHLPIGASILLRVKDVGFIEAKVTRQAFWNSDADEPCWEIETDNGFSDEWGVWERIA